MNIKKENISLILSACAIIVSVIALYRAEPFNIEVANFLVGVSSLTITVYVGMQIYYTIDTKRQMEKRLQETENRIKREEKEAAEKRIEDYDNTVNAYLIQIYTISTDLSKGDYAEALDGFMNALYRANKGSNKDPILGIIDFIGVSLNKIEGNRNEDNEIKFRIKEEKKKEYIEILSNTGFEESIALIERISRIKSI